MRIDLKPGVIVVRRRAEHNPDRKRLTIQFLFSEQTGGREDAGEIILINGDRAQDHYQSAEAVLFETERR